jgi:hypothetical protein
MPHSSSIRPSPYQPPSREQIERARDMYGHGFTVSRILAACDMALGTLYYWLDGGARRKQVIGKRRRPLETSRVSLAARLWRTAEGQVRDIEERLSRPCGSAVERERDVRMLSILVRSLRDLALFDPGAPAQGPTHAAPVDDDPVPEDMDEFRNELARRIRGFLAQRQAQRAAEAAGDAAGAGAAAAEGAP